MILFTDYLKVSQIWVGIVIIIEKDSKPVYVETPTITDVEYYLQISQTDQNYNNYNPYFQAR